MCSDPKYQQPYPGLGTHFPFMRGDKQVRAQPFADGRPSARNARELERRFPEGHAALGLIAMNYDWDWPRAEKEFRRAIALNPNYSVAHHWYAEWLAVQGRFDESLREIETALHLDPTSMVIPGDTGKYLIFARRFEQAQEKLKESLTLDPKWGRSWLAFAYAKTGQFEKAFAELREMERIDTSGWTSGLAAYVYGLANNRAQAEKMLAQTEERLDASNDLLPLAYAYIALGDNERAMSCLERDCDAHATSMTPLKVFPLYDPLRSDPRFLDLMRRVHLAP